MLLLLLFGMDPPESSPDIWQLNDGDTHAIAESQAIQEKLRALEQKSEEQNNRTTQLEQLVGTLQRRDQVHEQHIKQLEHYNQQLWQWIQYFSIQLRPPSQTSPNYQAVQQQHTCRGYYDPNQRIWHPNSSPQMAEGYGGPQQPYTYSAAPIHHQQFSSQLLGESPTALYSHYQHTHQPLPENLPQDEAPPMSFRETQTLPGAHQSAFRPLDANRPPALEIEAPHRQI